MSKKQIINPYVRFGPNAKGPYANRIAGGTYARAPGAGRKRCFFITNAEIGAADPDSADVLNICFNEDASAGCQSGFQFRLNDTPYTTQTSGAGATPNCVNWTVSNGALVNGTGPLDTVTFSYTPGTCSKSGEVECALDEIANYSVKNNIWGPNTLRVGDQGDDLVILVFPTTPASAGNSWEFKVNDVVRGAGAGVVVGNSLRFTLASPVNQGDTVTATHTGSTVAAKSEDGRACWRFFDMPVSNVVGISFWLRQDTGPWLLNPQTGRWELA